MAGIPSIPSAAALGGVAASTGTDRLYVAVGVRDFGAASSSAGGNAHDGTVWASVDGTTWAKAARIDTARMLWDVAYGNGRFVAVGDYSGKPESGSVILAAMAIGAGAGVWTSGDGRQWTPTRLSAGGAITGVVYGDAGFVAVGSDPDCSQGCDWDQPQQTPIHVSHDGSEWSSTTFPGGSVLDLAALPGHGYVAIGSDPATCAAAVWHSDDGATWQQVAAAEDGCPGIHVIVAAGEAYVGLGLFETDSGGLDITIRMSDGGRAWTAPVLVGSGLPDVQAIGVLDGAVVFSTRTGIWEIVPGENRLRGPADNRTFSIFGAGIGLDVLEKGGRVLLPGPPD